MRRILIAALFVLALGACDKKKPDVPGEPSGGNESLPQAVVPVPAKWDGKKQADISYQVLVYSFADSDGNGWGDFAGITSKMDYFDSLGVSALWLSPIHPSQSYHGYDVTDYGSVNPRLGTLDSFKNLVSTAHNHGIKIYLDFVLNHTGDQHFWFKNAKASTTSPYREYYIFSQNPSADIAGGKIPMIASERSNGYNSGEWFSAGSGWYYHANFNTGMMPDLNYGPVASCSSSPAFKAVIAAAGYWISLGVDGFRLDAVKHIYHNTASNENPTFLKAFYDHCNTIWKANGGSGNIYVIGEVLSEHDQVAPYYNGLPALFDFSFWYRLQWALTNKTGRYFASDILSYQKEYAAVRADYIEATKLSNHDEDRAAEVLGRDDALVRQAAAILLTAGGSPYLYQGEELGYYGNKGGGDEYVRGPIVWDAAAKQAAKGALSSKVITAMLTSAYSVETQAKNGESVLQTYRRFAQLRNTYPALAKGTMQRHDTYNENNADFNGIACWYMVTSGEKLLVVHNLGDASATLGMSDDLSRPIALLGNAKTAKGKLYLGAHSSVVFKVQ
ncbi:MAG: alpha-amylase [Bacteroidales bacterium]|nr:alpha-amylase [Bacteroidales bacterium]